MSVGAPKPWDICLDDGSTQHNYMVDTARMEEWKHQSIPLLRPIYVTADRLGENDINPESLWRFSDRDWSHGAGQRRSDMPDSDDARFWKSQGIDPWTKYQIGLLSDTNIVGGSPPSNITGLVSSGDYLYATTYTSGVWFASTSDLTTWTSLSDSASGSAVWPDGNGVFYNSSTGNELARATLGSSTGSIYNSSVTADVVALVAGRLMCVDPTTLHISNVTGTGAGDMTDLGPLPDGFTPVAFAPGATGIYVLAEFGGFVVQVFKIGISDDGTTLTVPAAVSPPIPAAFANAMFSWVGLIFLGLDNGFRMCVPDSSGALSVGALVQTGTPVRCFTGRDRYVYFGWDDFAPDGMTNSFTGLGRIDPSIVQSDGSPAYASDLMVSVTTVHAQTRAVTVVDPAAGEPLVFATVTQLAEQDTTNLVPSGYIDSGLITFDLPDEKSARYLTVVTNSDSRGEVASSIAVDGSDTFSAIGSFTDPTVRTRMPVPGAPQSAMFEVRETLTRSADPTQGPVVTRHMLEADPVVDSGFFYFVPLLLFDKVTKSDGQDAKMDVAAERDWLYALRESDTIVTYTELGKQFQATVEDIQWLADHITADRTGVCGTAILKLKSA